MADLSVGRRKTKELYRAKSFLVELNRIRAAANDQIRRHRMVAFRNWFGWHLVISFIKRQKRAASMMIAHRALAYARASDTVLCLISILVPRVFPRLSVVAKQYTRCCRTDL